MAVLRLKAVLNREIPMLYPVVLSTRGQNRTGRQRRGFY